jgi:hypothetical protein
MSSHCLNCNTPLISNYCAQCGQKASTHRYSIRHFIEHDVIHSIWHVDKGILFTLKQLFTRPGHSIREYIEGKRVGYFSFFTLLLLLLGFSVFLNNYKLVEMADIMPASSKETMNKMQKFMKENPKAMLMIMIPISSIFSFLWFRKAKLNFSEHLVMNAYKAVTESILGLVITLSMIATANISILRILYSVISLLSFAYSFWYYKQFFSAYGYRKKALIFRILGTISSFFILSFLVGIILGLLKGNGKL